MYRYRARVISVYDGDTLRLDVDLGCDIRINMTVRLHGINCPEKRTESGQAARGFTIDWLSDHQDADGWLTLSTVKDRKEKYGRYLGIVSGLGETLNDALIQAGHAVDYDGGSR